jgi:hypothetical protein
LCGGIFPYADKSQQLQARRSQPREGHRGKQNVGFNNETGARLREKTFRAAQAIQRRTAESAKRFDRARKVHKAQRDGERTVISEW